MMLEILKFVLEDQGVYYAREIALKLALPERSTYHRLGRLVKAGFLLREHNNYRANPALLNNVVRTHKIRLLEGVKNGT